MIGTFTATERYKYLLSHYIVGNIMKALVKMDEKGRVQIPTKIRKLMKLNSKQTISIEVKDNTAFFKKADRPEVSKDKVLRDILLKPARSKIRVTRELLDKLKEEAWTP
jgi:bifunctional DNA-binding transcriptional regulator/antitoxin component of YhaV-PrlF toxin-antitoxin module